MCRGKSLYCLKKCTHICGENVSVGDGAIDCFVCTSFVIKSFTATTPPKNDFPSFQA